MVKVLFKVRFKNVSKISKGARIVFNMFLKVLLNTANNRRGEGNNECHLIKPKRRFKKGQEREHRGDYTANGEMRELHGNPARH